MRVRFHVVAAVLLLALVALAAAYSAPAAERDSRWRPGDIVATTAVLADVLAANARTSGAAHARLARRRERWTYANGARHIAVDVAVRDDDFRTSLELGGLTYTAGRRAGARWRGDGNGIVHGVQADLQGDALDRAPQAVFRLNPAACTLAGETRSRDPAWAIESEPAGDKTAFLYVDKATGSIVREVMRDGRRVVTTTFDRFQAFDGAQRPRHWHIDDGERDDALDVTVDSIESGDVMLHDVAFPTRRTFAAAAPLESTVELPAVFRRGRVGLTGDIDGTKLDFLLDTGTAGITIDAALARRYGGATLEHAVLPQLAVGPLRLERVSTLTVPFRGAAILGYDFFFGHVVEIDYRRSRVRVLSAADASAIFADAQTTSVEANVDQGLPLIHAGFGVAKSDSFAIDTGSPRLHVMQPFARRFATEIAAHWTPVGPSYVERYLEGGIEVRPFRAALFEFGQVQAHDVVVGAQIPTKLTDDLAIPFDGIIGSDLLSYFDLYFDYDNGRIGVRTS